MPLCSMRAVAAAACLAVSVSVSAQQPKSAVVGPSTAKRIVLVGDSTVNHGTGWGDAFCDDLASGAECLNMARNGRSSKSYREQGWWASALALKPTVVLIGFGANDTPGKGPERETDPKTTFASNMRRYVEEARAAGATPVLYTPMPSRKYEAGKFVPNLGEYAQAIREVAKATKTPLVDLYARSVELLRGMSQVEADGFDHVDAAHPEAPADRTHLNAEGAQLFGSYVAEEFAVALPAMAGQVRIVTPGGTEAGEAIIADTGFRAVYMADDAWRRSRPGEEEADRRFGPEHLPHVDEKTQQEELDHWNAVLRQLSGIEPKALSPAEQVNFEVYRAQIVVLDNQQKFREWERPMNSDSAFWSELTGNERNGFRNAERYERTLGWMTEVPRYFEEQTANMRTGLKRGFTPPKVTLEGRDQSIRSVAEAKTPQDTDFYKPFEKMPASMPESEQKKLQAQAVEEIRDDIIPAYKKLLRFFDDEYVPHAQVSLAAEDLPDGKAYYQSLILEYTTTTLTPAEIHDIGLKEMAGIHAEMLETMKAAGFKGDLPAFLHFLRTDPQFYAKTPEELLLRSAGVAKEFDGVASRFFGYLPRQRFAIVPVPADIAPFYTSARGGPGIYLVNTYDLAARPLYSLPALTLHESAPGHAFQMPIAAETERRERRPAFRDQYISAYGEGWALYCERLGTEMGIYHTPYQRFGMLSYQAWRAARLVVDTGVHAQGWTREQARQYLRDNTALSEQEIDTEVDRYISWPGQALSYYLGEMSILKERHKAEAALGTKFNLRAFHDEVLSLGSVPLPVLEEQVNAWIARGGVGPYPEMEQ